MAAGRLTGIAMEPATEKEKCNMMRSAALHAFKDKVTKALQTKRISRLT